MNEHQEVTAEHGALPEQSPLPVYQRPESIAYAGFSVMMSALCVADVAEAVDKGVSGHAVYGVLSAGLVSCASGFSALRAHKETVAYQNASDEERQTLPAVERQRCVRSMRTVAWGGATVILGEVSILEAINSIHADTTAEGIAKLAISGAALAAAGLKGVPGLRKSLHMQKKLKETANSLREEQPQPEPKLTFVSDSYKTQLDDLASHLVTPKRFGNQK